MTNQPLWACAAIHPSCDYWRNRLVEAERIIMQIAHDDLEFGGLRLSAQARQMMEAYLANRKNSDERIVDTPA